MMKLLRIEFAVFRGYAFCTVMLTIGSFGSRQKTNTLRFTAKAKGL